MRVVITRVEEEALMSVHITRESELCWIGAGTKKLMHLPYNLRQLRHLFLTLSGITRTWSSIIVTRDIL